MPEFVQPVDATELAQFCALPGTSEFAPSNLPDADEHWMVRDRDAAQARCSLWWTSTPRVGGKRTGYIGHYGAAERAVARDLLRHAARRLSQQGCELAIGPIDGSTWKRYRLLSERGSEPSFFLEPDNPDDWPSHFTEAGFQAFAHFSSAGDNDLHVRDPRAQELAARMSGLGVRIRTMNPDAFTEELKRIYSVSIESFKNNLLYTPLSQAECIAMYEPLRHYIRPELVFIAERGAQPVGFAFSVPDWLQAKRGVEIDTLIVKTLAIVPQRELSGLGGLLLDSCRARAAELGYRRAIHALMYDGNVGSRRLSDRFGMPIRGYTLYALALAS